MFPYWRYAAFISFQYLIHVSKRKCFQCMFPNYITILICESDCDPYLYISSQNDFQFRSINVNLVFCYKPFHLLTVDPNLHDAHKSKITWCTFRAALYNVNNNKSDDNISWLQVFISVFAREKFWFGPLGEANPSYDR